MQVTIAFDPSEPAEQAAAAAAIARFGPAGGGGLAPEPARGGPASEHPAVRLHRQTEANESRRLVEALTESPLTFPELAERMPLADGSLHSSASMRAIYRNVRRREKTLTDAGILGGPVVQADFSGYPAEGQGRYHLERDAVEALDVRLGR